MQGLLIGGGDVLERLASINYVALDKVISTFNRTMLSFSVNRHTIHTAHMWTEIDTGNKSWGCCIWLLIIENLHTPSLPIFQFSDRNPYWRKTSRFCCVLHLLQRIRNSSNGSCGRENSIASNCKSYCKWSRIIEIDYPGNEGNWQNQVLEPWLR